MDNLFLLLCALAALLLAVGGMLWVQERINAWLQSRDSYRYLTRRKYEDR